MKTIYPEDNLIIKGPSIFLAGPTPRRPSVESWRPAACEMLDQLGFQGTVLIPERRDWKREFDYIDQVEWEYEALDIASVLAFWVPRNVETLPGFTTNVEFGRFISSGRLVYGRPDGAPHNRYLDWLYRKIAKRVPCAQLDQMMSEAVEMTRGDH
jgi:hypothetical protein